MLPDILPATWAAADLLRGFAVPVSEHVDGGKSLLYGEDLASKQSKQAWHRRLPALPSSLEGQWWSCSQAVLHFRRPPWTNCAFNDSDTLCHGFHCAYQWTSSLRFCYQCQPSLSDSWTSNSLPHLRGWGAAIPGRPVRWYKQLRWTTRCGIKIYQTQINCLTSAALPLSSKTMVRLQQCSQHKAPAN